VLELLHESSNCDLAMAQVWGRTLDDGTYLCSQSTMHRLLRGNGESKERRRQRTHPAKKKPELMATAPNSVWSWDIERHEALVNREEVEDLLLQSVAAG
jgi:putative transposase